NRFLRSRRADSTRVTLPSLNIRVAISESLRVPTVVGGEVILPTRALSELNELELESVLAHERAHVERADARWQWISALLEAVFFFQPLHRVASRRLKELAECLCDDEAILRTGSPVALVSALGIVASWLRDGSRLPVTVPAMADRESLTLRRVRRALTRDGTHA